MWRRIVNALARRAAPPSAVTPSSRRDRLALIVGLVTVLGLVAAFVLADGTRFLMPGPLASAHGTIERCSDCHTKSGTGKLSWIHGLVAGDRQADSKACLTCHSMADTAFNAHGAAAEVLDASTRRLMRLVAETPVPKSAMAQSVAFPAESVVARGSTARPVTRSTRARASSWARSRMSSAARAMWSSSTASTGITRNSIAIRSSDGRASSSTTPDISTSISRR